MKLSVGLNPSIKNAGPSFTYPIAIVGDPSARLRNGKRLMRLPFLQQCSGSPPLPTEAHFGGGPTSESLRTAQKRQTLDALAVSSTVLRVSSFSPRDALSRARAGDRFEKCCKRTRPFLCCELQAKRIFLFTNPAGFGILGV